jgi:hypothetical protein
MVNITSIKEIFTQEFLTNLLSTASYGSPWFVFQVHKDTDDKTYNEATSLYECREDRWAYILFNGGSLNIVDVDDEDEEEHKVTLEDIIRGFEIVMLNYPEQYCSLMTENDDFYDADAVIQCAIFGELTYG